MTLLFGQLPQGAYVDAQFTLHALVGSVGDLSPRPIVTLGGGGNYSPAYVRRSTVSATPPQVDDDLISALAILTILQTDNDL
jgi:hypothetical protein